VPSSVWNRRSRKLFNSFKKPLVALTKCSKLATYRIFFPGGSNALARQIFKRLETENFCVEQIVVFDELGIPETRSRANKGKKNKGRKNIQKPKYRFNRDILKTNQYADYFNPDPKVEHQLLDVKELLVRNS
jgi:hypothetical protein